MIPTRPSKIIRSRLPRAAAREPLSAILEEMRHFFVRLGVIVYFLSIPGIKAALYSRELDCVFGPRRPGRKSGVVAVVPYFGNARQLDVFLDYHRGIGVEEFVFLDLSAAGELADSVRDRSHCAVWRPRRGSDKSHALYWQNYLRRRYASGRWCLSLEPCERLVFYRSETRHIRDLVEFVESEHGDHVFAVLVDMYGDRPASAIEGAGGPTPCDQLRYFDSFGYGPAERGRYADVLIRGGVQRRTLFSKEPQRSPALNRVPLVKWRWYFAYVAGRRLLMPRHLNLPHTAWHSSTTACLLRYALLDDAQCLDLAAEVERAGIVNDGRDSSYAGIGKLRHRSLKHDFSQIYEVSENLVEAGLLNPGQWF